MSVWVNYYWWLTGMSFIVHVKLETGFDLPDVQLARKLSPILNRPRWLWIWIIGRCSGISIRERKRQETKYCLVEVDIVLCCRYVKCTSTSFMNKWASSISCTTLSRNDRIFVCKITQTFYQNIHLFKIDAASEVHAISKTKFCLCLFVLQLYSSTRLWFGVADKIHTEITTRNSRLCDRVLHHFIRKYIAM